MGNCSIARVGADFQIPQLEPKNLYGSCDNAANEVILKSVFPLSYDTNRQSKVSDLIQKDKEMLFEDPKFRLSDKGCLRLSVLFNFTSHSSRIFRRNEQTDISSFIQLNIEFTYLTSVFYHLCRRDVKQKMLPQLIENMETNAYGAYSCYLHCNGEKQLVIIDDRMPTLNDNFLYLRVVKGIQLWPLLLEKAWCKMIGSYERALGLSPEDAFEEITGAPAYAYTIRANNRQVIRSVLLNAVKNKYWVAFVARNGLSDLQNRQVFYLQSMDLDEYTIISPYVSYAFERYPQKRRGEVVVKEEDIFSHFEHVIVGFHHEGYTPVTLPVRSRSREEIVFQLTIKKREDVSIRFNQLYNGYFKPQDRQIYEYSPILMELYEVSVGEDGKQRCKILDYCQGCTRSIVGARSSECMVNIMERLEGKYLIRLEVGWKYDGVINEGNIVVYASEGNVQLSQMRNSQILFKEVYPDIFMHDGTNSIILHQHNLEVHTFDKEKTTLIEFHNVTSSTHHFMADFNRSRNVMIRGKEVKGEQAFIRLKADEKTIIEVLPLEMSKRMEIQNFQIHKLDVKE